MCYLLDKEFLALFGGPLAKGRFVIGASSLSYTKKKESMYNYQCFNIISMQTWF